MIKTPIREIIKPVILNKLILSLKKIVDKRIINIGEDVYIIPMFVTVVEIPAIKGKAPQTPQPIAPKKKILEISFLIEFLFSYIFLKKKREQNKKYSCPPPKS